MTIIDNNVSYLTNFDFATECRSLSGRQEGDKFVSHLNLMINKDSGEILKLSKKVYVFPDSLVSLIELKRPLKEGDSLELENLGPLGQELPEQIASVIAESFAKFNKMGKSS